MIVLLFIMLGSLLFGQSLPHNLSEDEKKRLYEIGINRTITDPPDSIIYAPAEFDTVAGILFAWEAYSTLLTDLIKEVAEDDTAWIIVDNSTEQNSVYSTLTNANVNMDHVVFEVVPTNSVWIRDYGPWWIYEPGDRRGIIDLTYNRPRPQDDSFPELFAE
ncbi:uncharacterized protein METZ01_LOCUS39931, partial [marine metagenome]